MKIRIFILSLFFLFSFFIFYQGVFAYWVQNSQSYQGVEDTDLGVLNSISPHMDNVYLHFYPNNTSGVINSIELVISGHCNDHFIGEFQIDGHSFFSSSKSVNLDTYTEPTHVVYYFDTPATYSAFTTEIVFIPVSGGCFASGNTFMLYGSEENVFNSSDFELIRTGSSLLGTPYFSINGVGAGNYTIDEPVEGSYLTLGEYEFSGTCSIVGEDQLYFGSYDLSPFYNTWMFNVDCVNGLWSATSTIVLGSNFFQLADRDIPESAIDLPHAYYFGYEEDPFAYSLSILYPADNDSRYFVRQASDDAEMRFGYNLPDMSFNTSTSFQLLKYDLPQFSGGSSSLANNTFSILDEDEVGSFVVRHIVASSTAIIYYSAIMTDFDDNEVYKINFKIDGSGGSDTPEPDAPPVTDFGFWGNLARDLFVPKHHFMLEFVSDIRTNISSVVPFYYFYQLKGSVENLSVASSTATSSQFSFSVPVGDETLDINFFDTSLTPVSLFLAGIRPYAVWGLWILLLMYILERFFDLNL